MARKSSFLQGFEVGTDLYNKGFSQAQSMAQMKLQQDAQEERKKRLAMEIEEFKAIKEERQRKLDNRKLALGRLDAFRSFVQDTKMDFKKPEDVRSMYEVLRTFRPEIDRDPEAAKALGGWLEGIEKTEGANLIKWAEEEKKATLHYNVTQKLSKQAADNKLVSEFNNNWGTHYTTNEIPEINKWKRQIATMEDTAKETGTIDSASFGDFEGFDQLSSHLDGIAAGQQALRKQGVEDTAAAQRLAYGNKTLFSQLEAFNSTAKEMGQPGLDFNNPSDRAKVTAYTQFKPIQDEAAAVGTAGLTILSSIKPGSNGVYSQQDLISARAQIAELKQDMDESPERKKNLNDAYVKLRADGSIKQYQSASGQLDQMREVKDLGTAAADIGMIFMFMKALDPTSVVREGEQATAQNATGVPDRVRNVYNNILSGNRLNATQRAEFYEAAEGSVTGLQKKAINVIDSFSDQFETVYGKRHNFTPIRDLIGLPKVTFSSQKDYEANKGNLQPGQEFIIKDSKGNLTTGTAPKETSEASSQNESILRGTREEIQNLINAGKAEGRYKPGQKVPVIDPNTGKQVMLTVPGDMEEGAAPEPKPNMEFNPNEPAEGPKEPVPGADQGVEGETEQEKESPYDPTLQERRKQRMSQYRKQSGASDEPAEGPKGPIPGADQGVEGEMEEAEDITPWESEEERQAMVDGQVKEYRAIQEFQKLADNGGGGDPYSFVRHRVKIGGTTGEIVRTNSRGVFIKIPNGPTRFMSWGGLSKRIESGDFKPNKARLNQQLKGE